MTVMYTDRMQATAQGGSPSAAKPAQVMRDWRDAALPLRVLAPSPARVDALCLAHDRGYVEDVLARRRNNGFGTRDDSVAASLPYTTGAMLDGARVALAERAAVCAPVSGFHHARWAQGAGFCTFNGLVVTALAVHAEGRARRVAILDCDQHHGDGTDEILARLGEPSWLHHFSAGAHFGEPDEVGAFFARLDEELRALDGCDLVLYQAGADPHVDDPLGGWLTTEQLRERDARVFEGVARAGVALVWNLAGGYQRDRDGGIAPVLAIHANTAREHLRVFGGGLYDGPAVPRATTAATATRTA
jgi:acetoin utilization deacetylase AcuC-like enzyme